MSTLVHEYTLPRDDHDVLDLSQGAALINLGNAVDGMRIAAKTLVQHLCKRFKDPDKVHGYILSV
jgi:hypothetical protein